MAALRSALLLALVAAFAACEIERRPDADPLVRLTDADTTLACGAFDVPPDDSTSRVLFAARRDEAHRALALPDAVPPDSAAPNPREVNPPSVEIEGAPPARTEVEPAAGLAVPVTGIRPGDLVDTFTAARGQGRVHNAVDILAPRGRAVVAAAPGTVLRLFESERGGLTIYQLGLDGETVYYYAHLDAYAPGLAAGDAVQRGDTIATVGDSGNAAPGNTHLHFAMWTVTDPARFWDGEPINPYPLLRDAADPSSATGGSAAQP
ncbi:MAG: M23 family metallopeptidase [Rhodothermales bacterium]